MDRSNSMWKMCLLATAMSIGMAFMGCTNSPFKSMFRKESVESTNRLPLTIWHDSFEAAISESESTGKPILADFTGSDWCTWCVRLKEDVFETEEFKSWARDHVVLLELDYPKRGMQTPELKRQNAELKDRYNIEGYPTVLLLDSSGQVLGKLGYMNNPAEWIATAESYLGFVEDVK